MSKAVHGRNRMADGRWRANVLASRLDGVKGSDFTNASYTEVTKYRAKEIKE